MTGPLAPAPASWMWAAVGVMPITSTEPVTDMSAPTAIMLLPVAVEVLGGTSCAPLSIMLPAAFEGVTAGVPAGVGVGLIAVALFSTAMGASLSFFMAEQPVVITSAPR